MYYTYVLECVDGSYYVGSTASIKDRLNNHIKGCVKYTKSRLPIRLIFAKEFNDYKGAFQFEQKIKSWKKRTSIEKMLGKSDNIAHQLSEIV